MDNGAGASRREFIKVSALAGGGLLFTVSLAGCRGDSDESIGEIVSPAPTTAVPPVETASPPFEPNLFVKISADGTVVLTIHRSEMGQGVRTALAMILAEELGADLDEVQVEQAPADRAYGDQVTGGSRSVQSCYSRLRIAGATARAMLIMAAAKVWGVDPETCVAEKGKVAHDGTGQSMRYGDLIGVAATLPIPPRSSVSLKDPADFALIGTSPMRIDEPEIVDGRAVFGIDVRVPGLLYATIARSPVLGGKLEAYDAAAAEAVEGVVQVVEIENGLVVVAENTWAAIQGREALDLTWDGGPYGDLDSEAIHRVLEEEIQSILPPIDHDGPAWVEATYEVPYLAHATMEPMNCTAHVREEDCSVWAPTQDAQGALSAAGSASRLPAQVFVPLIGCGLGRRLEEDYVREATLVSKAVNAPVQVVWTREDDIRHGSFRPTSLHVLRAQINERGQPTSWTHYIAGQSIGSRGDLEGGATGPPYTFSRAVRTATPDLPVPTGYWRAVYNTQNGFANECFLDEFAEAAGIDPLELRLEAVNSRMAAVLELAAEKGNWGAPLPAGWGRGLACHNTWGMSDVAQVAEVSVDEGGSIRVHRVVSVIDCGIAINPDMVVSQMESGIIVGLTAALMGEITITEGRVEQSNFHDYPLLRMQEAPKIEVHIIPSGREPAGVGEMGVPPIAPAVANALYAVTGSRIRKLPI